MRSSVLRAAGITVVMLAIYEGAAFVDFLAMCDGHRAWQRRQADDRSVIRDQGFGVARSGDAIFACAQPHCFGPLACHDDLVCLCAPAEIDPIQLNALVAGNCVVDHPKPSLLDEAGACRHARCDDHVDP